MTEVALATVDPPKQIVTENTYISDPEGYGGAYVIKQDKIQQIISDTMEQRLSGLTYDPVKGAQPQPLPIPVQQAKQLADDIKERVKTLGFNRHKIIVQVLLGQRKGQAVRVVSRCLWDTHSDTAASASFQNETVYCVSQVYGLFVE